MATLTVTEKEKWRDMISRRIDREVEQLKLNNEELLKQTEQQAREQAIEKLGIGQLMAKCEAAEAAEKAAKEATWQAEQELAMMLGEETAEDSARPGYWNHCHNKPGTERAERSIKKWQSTFNTDLLKQTEAGRRIVELSELKEQLCDAIWLATAPGQLKNVWKSCIDIVGGDLAAPVSEALGVDSQSE